MVSRYIPFVLLAYIFLELTDIVELLIKVKNTVDKCDSDERRRIFVKTALFVELGPGGLRNSINHFQVWRLTFSWSECLTGRGNNKQRNNRRRWASALQRGAQELVCTSCMKPSPPAHGDVKADDGSWTLLWFMTLFISGLRNVVFFLQFLLQSFISKRRRKHLRRLPACVCVLVV